MLLDLTRKFKNERLVLLLGALIVVTAIEITAYLFIKYRTKSVNVSTPVSFYVSPEGDDSNPGTIIAPFRTLNRARDAVRNVNSGMGSDITVYLRGGYYQLDAPLSLTNIDSGTNGHFIVYRSYPGETVMLSGGKTVTGWQQSGNIWKAYVGNVNSRQFFVNGVRATRARGLTNLNAVPAAGGFKVTTPIASWHNINDVEVLDRLSGWKEFRCGIDSATKTSITLKEPCFSEANSQPGYTMTGITRVENALELLDAPGEWYLDKPSGYIYYMPFTGQDMTKVTAVIPVLEQLINGSGSADYPVKNIRFEGIIFAYATWLAPSKDEGFPHIQAEFYGPENTTGKEIPGNISFVYGENIQFIRNIFTRLGAEALNLGNGTKNALVSGNYFGDISGAAITLGGNDIPKTTDTRQITGDNQITNNYIQNTGVDYRGSVGIWVGYAQNSLISHNELVDLPYTGISIGWGWGQTDPTVAKDNTVSENYIHRVMQKFNDGGGIYSLGAQPGNLYTKNFLKNIGAIAIYLDEGSRFITATNNLIAIVNKSKIVKGSDNTLSNNDDKAGGKSTEIGASAGLEKDYQNIINLPDFPQPPM